MYVCLCVYVYTHTSTTHIYSCIHGYISVECEEEEELLMAVRTAPHHFYCYFHSRLALLIRERDFEIQYVRQKAVSGTDGPLV